MKINGITTPASKKKSNPFTIEVYKTFSQLDYSLSDKIVEVSGTIPASALTPGSVTDATFTS